MYFMYLPPLDVINDDDDDNNLMIPLKVLKDALISHLLTLHRYHYLTITRSAVAIKAVHTTRAWTRLYLRGP